MLIKLENQCRLDRLTAERRGDILLLNGEAIDLGPLPEGAILPAAATGSPWLVGDIERRDGQLHLTLILPHGPAPTPAQAWPEPIIMPGDGLLPLPADEVSDGD